MEGACATGLLNDSSNSIHEWEPRAPVTVESIDGRL